MLFWFRPWDSFFQEMTLNLSDILNDRNNRWMAKRELGAEVEGVRSRLEFC